MSIPIPIKLNINKPNIRINLESPLDAPKYKENTTSFGSRLNTFLVIRNIGGGIAENFSVANLNELKKDGFEKYGVPYKDLMTFLKNINYVDATNKREFLFSGFSPMLFKDDGNHKRIGLGSEKHEIDMPPFQIIIKYKWKLFGFIPLLKIQKFVIDVNKTILI